MRLPSDMGPAGATAAPVLDAEDRVDLGAIVAHALGERAAAKGAMPDLLGLDRRGYGAVADLMRPIALPDLDRDPAPFPEDQTALATLIAWRGGARTPLARALAAILARRAMEPNHLWEDLGLTARPRLTALIGRHFPRLVALNDANMRWKKFFYRQICADAAFSLCLAPTCDACSEYADCFAPEDA